MKIIRIDIDYNTNWGQDLYISGSAPELGEWDINRLKPMSYIGNSVWRIDLQIPKKTKEIDFKFYLLQGSTIINKESSRHHITNLPDTGCDIICNWILKDRQTYFNTSLFSNSVFRHGYERKGKNKEQAIRLLVSCIHVEDIQELVISGSNRIFGNWDEEQALALDPVAYGKWSVNLPAGTFMEQAEYKLAIRDKKTRKIAEWEEGANRTWLPHPADKPQIIELSYRKEHINWKASGVAIPVFSLRSEKSYGIGEFSDLKLLIDWAKKAKMRAIQILPINDTTSTHSWLDSYPYNAISIYALHPIYLGLQDYPLENVSKGARYARLAKKLNNLGSIDYNEVIKLKMEYIKDLFEEAGDSVLKTGAYHKFFDENKEWLYPYACFCYLRDKKQTTRIQDWGDFAVYNESKLKSHIYHNSKARKAVDTVFFTQFLLHSQLSGVKEYAYKNGVVLKGDIPIGISPNSVEAWTEPHLFNLDTQTGAPPDDFSINGQNWGFPTYNWDEMAKDNYRWWTRRFIKMADYFDAYRIDHILGFFRIWEIPSTSIYGLLGYFSPALPLTPEEIKSWNIPFDGDMTIASIHIDDIRKIFGEYSEEVRQNYLIPKNDFFVLKEELNNQKKIRAFFHGRNDEKSLTIREGLYQLCCEVLFIKDKHQADRFHPRIFLNSSLIYNRMPKEVKEQLYALHQYYFYNRHTGFWGDEAMKKLPTLVNSTNMLVCGEDLGMVPASVPVVMEKLQILSLEIQRMPKEQGVRFSDLSRLPYLSVSTSSTHDMSPLRMWWQEDPETARLYYTHVLGHQGEVPKNCDAGICEEIIKKHLNSPAMLAIHPLQDWLSMDEKLRRENPDEERINVPSEPQHNWNYRMHITLEQLNKETDFTERIYRLNEGSGR